MLARQQSKQHLFLSHSGACLICGFGVISVYPFREEQVRAALTVLQHSSRLARDRDGVKVKLIGETSGGEKNLFIACRGFCEYRFPFFSDIYCEALC